MWGFVKVLILFGAALASVLPQHGLLPLALLMTSLRFRNPVGFGCRFPASSGSVIRHFDRRGNSGVDALLQRNLLFIKSAVPDL